MPKVKITNLKAGACVINSLRLTIAGKSSVVRDAGVIGDPDLVELESEGIVSVEQVQEAPPLQPKPAQPVVQETRPQTAKPKPGKQGGQAGKNVKKPHLQPQQPSKPKEKPGTSFRPADGPEEEMGRTVVVMGEDGPVVKKMSPGINATGPKYLGDLDGDDPPDGDDPAGFTQV